MQGHEPHPVTGDLIPPHSGVAEAVGQPSVDEGLLWAMFQASPVASCLVRASDGAVLNANGAWCALAGGACELQTPRGFHAFAAPVALAIDRVLSGDPDSVGLRQAIALQGQGLAHKGHFQATRLPAPHGQLWLLVITETAAPAPAAVIEREAHQVLLQQVQLHPAIERLARVGHWTDAEEVSELIWSPGLYEAAGLPSGQAIDRERGRSGIHPDDREAWLAARHALDGRDLEYRWNRPDGAMRWLRSRMGRTVVTGQAALAFGVVQDITAEREAKLALARELGFVQGIANHVPGAIYRARRAADGTPSVSFVSASVSDVLGVDADAALLDPRRLFWCVVPEDLPGLLTLIDRTSEDLSPLRAAFRVDLPNRGRRWIQADATTQRNADGSTVWHGFITDVTDQLVAAKALERQHLVLQAVQRSQATFIEVEDKREAFDGLLASFLSVTESTSGFVAEVLYDAKAQPFLRTQAITNMAGDDAARTGFETRGEQGFELHSLKPLLGPALHSGETVIINGPERAQRAGGLPPGLRPLKSFLAVPIAAAGQLVAMVGLANSPDGFEATDVDFLQPLLGTVRELVMAYRAHAERRRGRLQFEATSALLQEKSAALQATFDSMNQGLTMIDASGRVRFYNRRLLELLNLPESLFVGNPLHADIRQFQVDRGDFGADFNLHSEHVSTLAPGENIEPALEKYVRRTTGGQVIEVFTRLLPEGGFVRTYTDVTSYVDTQEALREERQRLQWVLEATRPGIWEVNIETQASNYSDRWTDMLGYTVDELTPTTVNTWERLIHPDDLPRAQRQVAMHLSGDAAYYECDIRMRHKSGQWMWVNDRGRVHRRDTDGKALYMSGTLLDINDRVAAQEQVHSLNASLERRVAERTAELERSMKDMEAISYSIAHDLRAPLRSVNGFASLIADEESARLSPDARRMFERIAHSSRNMGQMITDMLELLRVVRVALDAVPVDMNALAQVVSDTLAPSAPHALIGIKPLPHVMGDATLLRQVLVNLMDNALKYSRHRPQPELVLGYDERQRAFYLSDNGMGFDMARADKLFGLFQRLHAASDVPGTGVGLAIVARIVERHGGRIWAEATAGQGATFWWTLPRA
jgi:PAS domain S-box-containing protein